MEIINMAVFGKFSDGTIRQLNTTKAAEVDILNVISANSPGGVIDLSVKQFKVLKIISVPGDPTLSEYIDQLP